MKKIYKLISKIKKGLTSPDLYFSAFTCFIIYNIKHLPIPLGPNFIFKELIIAVFWFIIFYNYIGLFFLIKKRFTKFFNKKDLTKPYFIYLK